MSLLAAKRHNLLCSIKKRTHRKMTHSENTTRIRVAIMTIAALTLVFTAVPHAQAAGVPNCNDNGGISPCFEMVWGERGPNQDEVCPRPISRNTQSHH